VTVAAPRLYSTYVGKKYAMAISGIVLMLFVLGHMIGNLKLYLGASDLNNYAEWLRTWGEPALPRAVLLDIARVVLVAAFAIHIHSAYALTRVNREARIPYASPREFAAADFASRTMRWTGVIVGLFVIFHLLDLTWGPANPDFVHGDPYHNVIESFQRVPVALVYVIANVALAIHLYHGAWSLTQSMGWVFPYRRPLAIVYAVIIGVGNVSFPLAVMFGFVG
jgi:succinate dehydrogenase / fumarate reductase cytochrome b subunit